jgi:hypothetical protein
MYITQIRRLLTRNSFARASIFWRPSAYPCRPKYSTTPVTPARIPQATNLDEDGLSIIELSQENKAVLFETALQKIQARESESKAILQNLQKINPALAEDFELKTPAILKSPVRMICSNRSAIATEPHGSIKSYLAVSYCWHTHDWVCANESPPLEGWPFSEAMAAAILTSCESEDVGIWIDQTCIDQINQSEKQTAVASMDVIYGSASHILILLEDVELSDQDASVIEAHDERVNAGTVSEWSATDQQARDMAQVFLKIMSARWFTRAWCAHEYRISNVWTNPSVPHFICYHQNGSTIRFPMVFLFHCIEHISRLLVFEDLQFGGGLVHQRETLDRRHRLMTTPHTISQDHRGRSYVRGFSGVLSLSCSEARDYLAIAFNICKLGLYFKGSLTTVRECHWIFAAIAFAAGDASSLTTNGPKLNLPLDGGEAVSWLQMLEGGGDAIGTALPQEHHVTLFTPELVELDMLFLETRVCQMTSESAKKAADFVNFCYSLPPRELTAPLTGRNQLTYPRESGFESVKLGAIACTLDSGLDWMLQAWQITGRILESINPNRFRTTVSSPDERLWPAVLKFLLNDEYGGSRREYIDENKTSILGFLSTLVEYDNLGLVSHAGRITTSAAGHLGLTHAKTRDWNLIEADAKYILAVPVALADQKYERLDRLWILEKTKDVPKILTPDSPSPQPKGLDLSKSEPDYPRDEIARPSLSTCERANAGCSQPPFGDTWRLVGKSRLVACPTLEADGKVVTRRVRQRVCG